MVKTNKKLALILSLVMLLLSLGSAFAISSIFTRPMQTVEASTLSEADIAYRRANPGLYETGTTTLKESWTDLISSGKISIANGHLQVTTTGQDMAGELVCGRVDGLTSLKEAFLRRNKLTSIDLSNLNTSNVTSMCSMFNGCSTLTSLDVSNFDTTNVTDMNSMFYNCSSLTSLKVDEWNTSNVTTMNGMFYGCTSLKNLDVSKWDTSKVTSFFSMFGGTKLDVLDMTNFSFDAVADATNVMGMLGINDIYCLGVLQQFSADFVPVYQMAMQNQDISAVLDSVSSSLASAYSSAIAGKSEDEVGYIGRVYIVGLATCQLFHEGNVNYMEQSILEAQTLFDTKIGTIYAPANAISLNISLPYNTNYVYLSDGTKTALPNQLLYGYKDIDSSLTELALFEGTLDKPTTKPSEMPTSDTGVVADISMVGIALVSVIGLAVVLTKKKRMTR